jgi:hypothetical protein
MEREKEDRFWVDLLFETARWKPKSLSFTKSQKGEIYALASKVVDPMVSFT